MMQRVVAECDWCGRSLGEYQVLETSSKIGRFPGSCIIVRSTPEYGERKDEVCSQCYASFMDLRKEKGSLANRLETQKGGDAE